VKRIVKRLSDVVEEVRVALASEYSITEEELKKERAKVDSRGHNFPEGSHPVPIDDLWIDYEVQRDVIPKHIIRIIRRYDPRLCGPASACKIVDHPIIDPSKVFTYDGQHRSIATALLGYDTVPCNTVITDDPAFASYAFEELNETGVKKLTPADLHRNRLTRYKLGSREEQNELARTLQDQFDNNGVDLEDKMTRKSPTMRGDNDYFFSHFKYAYKVMAVDKSGHLLSDILSAMLKVFPMQEEIDQGVFIGLCELARLDQRRQLPNDWMVRVLRGVKKSYKSSATVHSKAKLQWGHIRPGATWSAPAAMSNFIREVYLLNAKKDVINLPYHGIGSLMDVESSPAPGL